MKLKNGHGERKRTEPHEDWGRGSRTRKEGWEIGWEILLPHEPHGGLLFVLKIFTAQNI